MKPLRSNPIAVLSLAVLLAACGGRGDTTDSGIEADDPEPAAAPTGSGGTLVGNGDFERGQLAPWSTTVHADPAALTVTLDAAAAREGSAGLHLVASGTEPWGGVEQTVDAAPIQGRKLELSAWVRGQGMTGSPALMAVFQGGPWSQPVDLDFEGLGGDFEWQRISTQFEVPTTARSVRFGVLIKGGGVLWVDDVELAQVP
jgi:hypothetical protein